MNGSGITTLDWVIVVLFFAGIVGMGFWFSRKQKSAREYFLAGRSMPTFAVGLSIIATLLSAISFLAFPGEAIGKGAYCLASFLAVPLAFLIVNRVFIPFFMEAGVTSAYEYLDKRFNRSVCATAAVVFILIRLVWMGVVIYTTSIALAEMTGLNVYAGIIGVGLIAVVYTYAGGMRAVIWTDVLQFLILFGGAILTVFIILYQTGTGDFFRQGWAVISEPSKTYPMFPSSVFTSRSVFGFVLSGFCWYLVTFASDQVAIQRYLTTKNIKEARRSVWINFFANFSLVLVLCCVGVALLVYFRGNAEVLPAHLKDMSQPDKLFPWFIVHGLPVGITGLVISALFAASMSSLDSGIHSISTVVTVDFRKWVLGKDGDAMRTARFLTVVIGVVSIGWAILVMNIPGNIYEMSTRSTACLTGPLFAIFALGVLTKRATPGGVLAGALIGIAIGLVITYSQSWGLTEEKISFLLLIPASIVTSCVCGWVISLMTSRPREEQLKGLVYGSTGGD